MALFDILFLLPLALFIVIGYRKGLIIEITTLIALLIGIIASLKLTFYIVEVFSNFFQKSPYLPYVAFVLVFICFYMLVYLIGKKADNLLKAMNLNFFNRIAGAILGGVKIILIFSFLVWLTDLTNLIPQSKLDKSFFYRYFHDFAPAVVSFISSMIPYVKGIIGEIEAFFDQLVANLSK
jgi:membrane protein required for colicin V production